MSDHPDPVLRLLWHHDDGAPSGSRRGRKQRLSVADVVDAGIRIADRDGLPSLSMRLLATELGLGVMSLYTYVPGRDELLALMLDRVLGRRELPAMPDDLRGRIALVARFQYEVCQDHPWLLDISGLRAWVGPGASDLYEWQLSAVEGSGLDDVEMDQTVALLTGFAGNVVRAQQRLLQDERASGLTQAEWWAANADELDLVMAGRRYPLAGRVGAAAGEAYQAATDPAREMEFGLARIIDGLVSYIESKKGLPG
jgi:AcrR family transcriptional regulator